jgi:hypothetical protein
MSITLSGRRPRRRETTTAELAGIIASMLREETQEEAGMDSPRLGLPGELLCNVNIEKLPVHAHGTGAEAYRITVHEGQYRTGGVWDLILQPATVRPAPRG